LIRGGFVKLSPTFAILIAVLSCAGTAAAQSHETSAEIEPPILADAEPPPVLTDDLFQHAPVPSPPQIVRPARQGERIEPGSPADQRRTTVKTLAVHKQQFVHCRLQNGKVLTGLIRDMSDQGFSLHTNAIGGKYIHYANLAEPPRAVPAVGTRIKQGVQWTGVGVAIAVAIPLAIPLCLIIYPLIAAGVIHD
jgi:hypothetical protein